MSTHTGYIDDEFQSTLPMRGATFQGFGQCAKELGISIHTPHAGSDCLCLERFQLIFQISIHTPHAGSDYYVH